MKRLLLMLAFAGMLTACAIGTVPAAAASTVSVTLSPNPVTVQPGGTQLFTQTVTGTTDSRVVFMVNGVVGGNSTIGTIGWQGIYTAPTTIPAGGKVTIGAQSLADSTVTGNATVNIAAPQPAGVSVSLSPSSVSVPTGGTQTFKQTVTGTTDSRVVFMVNGITGGNSTIGTIGWQGIYTAPATVPAGGTVTIGAQSLADSTKYGYAKVTVTSTQPTTTVGVSISPTAAALQAGMTQQFTANVSGTTNTGVSWLVNGVQGGSATTGTISSTGVYTAPTTVPSGGSVTVMVRSSADTTKSASATVSLTAAPTSVSISVSPTSASLAAGATKQFTATVSGTSNTGVIWKVNGVQGGSASTGTISSTGLFTSPSCSSTSSVTVAATSAYDTSKSASASVSISGGSTTAGGYYVSNSGTDSNDGSACRPWATLKYAASRVSAGSVVHVAAGTYPGQVIVSASGTSSAPIQFKCDSYRQCKLVGQSYSSSWGKAAIVLTGSYVNITNFDITDDSNGAGGIYGYGGGHYQIVGNFVHDIPIPVCDGNGGGGIDLEATSSGGNSYITQNTVTNLGFATQCGRADAIYIAGPGTVAVNNVVYNSYGSGITVSHAAKNVIVAFNTVDKIKTGNGIGGDGVYLGCDSSVCDYNTIANNIVSNNQNAGIESYAGDSGDPASHNVYSSNLFYNNGTMCSFPGGSVGLSCTNNKSGNPIYAIPGSNYKILAGSAAIGTASTLDVPSTDFTGATRTSPNDIGAYIH